MTLWYGKNWAWIVNIFYYGDCSRVHVYAHSLCSTLSGSFFRFSWPLYSLMYLHVCLIPSVLYFLFYTYYYILFWGLPLHFVCFVEQLFFSSLGFAVDAKTLFFSVLLYTLLDWLHIVVYVLRMHTQFWPANSNCLPPEEV